MKEALLSLRVRKAVAEAGYQPYRLEDTGVDGVADLLITGPGHRCRFLELKTDSKLRPSQQRWLDRTWRRDRNAFVLKYDAERNLYGLWAGATATVLVAHYALWYNHHLDIVKILQCMDQHTNQATAIPAGACEPLLRQEDGNGEGQKDEGQEGKAGSSCW